MFGAPHFVHRRVCHEAVWPSVPREDMDSRVDPKVCPAKNHDESLEPREHSANEVVAARGQTSDEEERVERAVAVGAHDYNQAVVGVQLLAVYVPEHIDLWMAQDADKLERLG